MHQFCNLASYVQFIVWAPEPLAQLVEHPTFNQEVMGSMPIGFTMATKCKYVRERQKVRSGYIVYLRDVCKLSYLMIGKLLCMDRNNVRRTYLRAKSLSAKRT